MQKTVITKTERHVDKDGKVTMITRTEERSTGGSRNVTESKSTTSSSSQQVYKGEPSEFTPTPKGSLFGKLFGSKHGRDNNEKWHSNADSVSTGNETPKKGGINGLKGNPNVDECRIIILKQHNDFRAKHGAPPLKLDMDMCKYSQEWADKLARSGSLQHRSDGKYGENIFSGMNSRGIEIENAVQNWYDEVRNYNFGSAFSSGTGHFTQVVWKGSRQLGIGVAGSSSGSVFVVANYDPPGNMMSQFTANVSPAK